MTLMNFKQTLIAATMLLGVNSIAQEEQDSLGVIGDNLDLYAVLDLFKNSNSLEEFERSLNDPASKLNNLDLNEDGEVDYIQVYDEDDNDAHAFILRVDLNENESQDIAAIELEKTGTDEAAIQIVGDEDIYGKDYFVEPKGDEGITERLVMTDLIIINVWGWPIVRFIYGPTYVRWRSPYRWGAYPVWWKPWRPLTWRAYHNLHKHHHPYYHVVHVRRCNRAHVVYVKRRRTTVLIKTHPHHPSHHPHKNPTTKRPGNSGVGPGGTKKPGGGNRRR
ncbi:MAG: hypothetical protein R2780_03435 [Crocinitomicaceae bacterium]